MYDMYAMDENWNIMRMCGGERASAKNTNQWGWPHKWHYIAQRISIELGIQSITQRIFYKHNKKKPKIYE